MELFKLHGSILVDSSAANESISNTDKKAEGLGKRLLGGIGTAAKWGAGIAAAAGAGATALLGVANKAASAMDVIDKGSAKIGISKQAYQEWSYVLGQNGMDISKLEVGMKTLTSKMDAAASGTKSAQEAFDKLGVSWDDGNGKLKDQETMMNEALYALANMENGTDKARLATELFGKAGVEMMPMLNNGAESMDELTQRAHDLGLVVSDEAVSAGVLLGDTMADVQQSFSAVVTKIGVEVFPLIQRGLDWLLEKMPTIQAVLGVVFDVITTGVTAVIEFITYLIEIVQAKLPEIQSIVESVVTALLTFWDEHLKPCFEAIASFITDVLYPAFQEVFQNLILPIIQDVFACIMELWENTLKPVFTGIIDFITGIFSGNWSLAWSGIQNILSGVWNGIQAIVKAAVSIVGTLVQNGLNAVNTIVANVMSSIKNAFANTWNAVKTTVTNAINGVKSTITSGMNSALSAVTTILTNIKNKFSSILNSAKDVVGNAINAIKSKFNFSWSLPKLKLPHFSIKGEFSLNPPSVPKFGVEWYRDGGIMMDPTMFGINGFTGNMMVGGEDGPEAIAPIDLLQKYVDDAVRRRDTDMLGAFGNWFDKLFLIMEKYFPQFAGTIVLDDGTLVAKLAPKIDKELGAIATRKGMK